MTQQGLVVGIVLLMGGLTLAQNKPAPPSASHTVVVPYDHTKPIADQKADQFYLEYDTFQALWKQAKTFRENGRQPADVEGAAAKNEPEDFVISSALYKIFSTRDRLTVEGRLSLLTRGKAWCKVPLNFAGVNISSIEMDGVAASFTDGAILIEKPGFHEVTVKFELPLDEVNQAAAWTIPWASATLLEITMDSDLAEPVLLNNWPMAEVVNEQDSSKKVYLAALGQLTEVQFRRRLKTSSREMAQPNVATIQSHLFVAAGLERLETTYRLEFQGQEEDAFTIYFDDSITPVQFSIPNLSSWQMEPSRDGMRSLRFELTQPLRDRVEVTMIGERLSGELGETRTFPQMGADAARVVQQRSVVRVSDLDVATTPGGNHRQMEFVAAGVDLAGFVPVASYSLAGANEALSYVLSERESDRSAQVEYVFQAGRGKLETVAQFQMRSPDGPLFSATITLPGDGTIQSVDGNRVRDWWRTGNELFVRFSGPTPEVTALLVYIAQELDADATEMKVAPFELAGFADEDVTGSGLIVTHVTQDTVVNFDQGRQVVREVGANEVATDFEVLAPLERKRGLRFERADFSGTVRLTPIPPKFDSAWVMLARAHESWLDLSIRADLEITRSAIDRVKFSTADSVPEFRVISDDVREVKTSVADGRRNYEVRFQKFVTDAIYFNLETEIPHGGTGVLPDVVFADASREARYLIVENQSNDRMELKHSGVQTTVESLLPYTPETLLSADLFRAATADWNVAVTIEKLETSAGNEASISYAELTTAFRANGEEWVRAIYRLQNRSLQFLPVDLPEHAELISVGVAGNDVRADRGEIDGQAVALVPLIQTKPGQLAYDVELVFRSRDGISENGEAMKEFERQLDDPEIVGVTVSKTLWNIYLPMGHTLDEAEGNMDRVEATRNDIEKMRSELTELESLNYLAGDDGNGVRLRNTAWYNSNVLVERLDSRLNGVDANDAEVQQLKGELEKQKLIITENRIEMPVFSQQKDFKPSNQPEVVEFEGFINYGKPISGIESDGKKGKVTWGDNAEKFETRNTTIQQKTEEQIERIGGQRRLNDSISVGNKYFNNLEGESAGGGNGVDPFTDPEPNAAEEGEKEKQQKQSDQVFLDQNGKLSGNSAATGEVNEKLSALNRLQLGPDSQQRGSGGAEVAQREQMNRGAQGQGNGFIQLNDVQQQPQLEQQQEQQQLMPVEMQNLSYNNARSSLSKGGKAAASPQKPQQPVSPQTPPAVEPDPRSSRGPGNAPDAPGGGGLNNPAPQAPAIEAPEDDAFRAAGRQSVSVEFPVEGVAYHFQKIKDHAELVIESSQPADLERGKWLLWMLLSLAVLLLGYGLIGKLRDRLA